MDEERFKGIARLFPLPDLVMFPHVMQPLHIFEPRYIDLLNEALDSDGLIAMSMLAPGWESDYEGRPPVNPFACLGKIVTHQRQDDGHYNVLLLGMKRILIEEELPANRSFREAKVSLLDDNYYSDNDAARSALQVELTEKFQDALPNERPTNPSVEELLASEIPLGVLTDLVSFAVPLDLQTKTNLLGENDVDVRARMLLDALQRLEGDRSKDQRGGYLPPFSTN